MPSPDDLWIFAYGSLLWNPGFEVARTRPAVLAEYRRSFCMRSIHHRGSEAEPGLVLALEPHEGAACAGVAMRAAEPVPALAYLRERELVSAAYVEERVTLRASDGGTIAALAYVIDTGHAQYCPDLPLEDQARIIAGAVGGRGPNHEYLTRTAEGMAALGIEDAAMDWLVARVQQIVEGI